MIPDKLYKVSRTKQDISKATELQESILQQVNVVADSLATHVTNSFNYARDMRQKSGVEERMLKALRRRRREYDPADKDLVAATANIYIPIIDLKCRACLSWATDILANAEEQPWTLDPTPNPSIPQHIRETAINNLKQEIMALGISDMGAIVAAAKRYKSLAQEYVNAKAKDAANRMETILRDQLLEGGWIQEFHKFLDDATTYPAAILEAPVIRSRQKLRWDGDKLVTDTVLVREVERVDPFDVFPSFDSTDTQDGTYIILRKRLTYSFLYECLELPAFKTDTIRRLLDRFQNSGLSVETNADDEEDDLKNRDEQFTNADYIEGLVYYGIVKGQLLLDSGVLVDDPQRPYEAIVWVVNNETIYAVTNPFPLKKRPLYRTSFKKINGSFWGEALPDVLESIERMANAAARNLARNMAFSSGPIGEVQYERLSSEETDVRHIEPHRLYMVEPSLGGTSEPVFRFTDVPSHANELHNITEYYMKIADDISGIPAYVLGNPQVAGAGRTMGGLSMLMGNAAKGIKQFIGNIDRDASTPLVTMFYNIEMKFGEDEAAKVDAQVQARGANGILQRELSQSRTVELLQVLTPFVGNIPKEGMDILLREVLKTRGYNVDDIIPDPRRGSNLAALFGGQPNIPSMPSAQPGTPAPPLDGRSMPPVSPDTLSKLPQPANLAVGN